jgi:peptide/nickel transport system permease protein
MGQYIIRRILTAIPTLLSHQLDHLPVAGPGARRPSANLPLSIPQEVRVRIRESLGLDQPVHIRYVKWMNQFFIVEPTAAFEKMTGLQIGDSENRLRIVSWLSRGVPVIDLIMQRLPQTLWVVGVSYLLSVLIAVPLGVLAAYRQNRLFDQINSVIAVIGFSLPTFFTGLLVILVFGVWLGWFPTIYNTTLVVNSWDTFVQQVRQMVLPVFVLTFFQMAAINRFTRARQRWRISSWTMCARRAPRVSTSASSIVRHVVRNSLIPVVTLVALGIPGIFGGAIVTEQISASTGWARC